MEQLSPITPNPTQAITLFSPVEEQPRGYVLGSILARIVCQSTPLRIFDLAEFDALIWNPSFTTPRFSPAYLAARHRIIWAQDVLERKRAEEASDRFLKAEALTDFKRGNRFSADRGRQFEPLTNYNTKPGEKSYGELLEAACDGWPTRDQFITSARVRRPSWFKNEWERVTRIIGKPAQIAQMEWRLNMNTPDIAAALDMKPSAVQKAIARMGNDVSRLGLRGLDGTCTPRYEFALMEFREWGMRGPHIAAYLVRKWFGEEAVLRYKIADMYWQRGMEAPEIAEELQMSVGAVDMRISRLLEEGE